MENFIFTGTSVPWNACCTSKSKEWQTDIQINDGQSDSYVALCFANITQVYILVTDLEHFHLFIIVINRFYTTSFSFMEDSVLAFLLCHAKRALKVFLIKIFIFQISEFTQF